MDHPRAMASILGTWLHLYPEDFQQSPEFPCLKMLLAYIELNMPDSDLEQRARHFLAQLETLEPTEAEGHGEEDSGWVKRTGTNKEVRAGPHRAELPEAGTRPGALRRLRSLFPWTAAWEDFLGVGGILD